MVRYIVGYAHMASRNRQANRVWDRNTQRIWDRNSIVAVVLREVLVMGYSLSIFYLNSLSRHR